MQLITSLGWRCFIALVFVGASGVNAQQAKPVSVVKAEAGNGQQVLRLSGQVESPQNAILASQQAGLVAAIHAEVGDQVSKGDILLELDNALAKLSLAEAEASLEAALIAEQEANRLYREVLSLSKKKFVAKSLIAERRAAVSRSKAELSQQKAAVAIQQEQLRRHTLYAPFAGVIASRGADLGEWINQQSQVFTLVQQQGLRLSVAIPQEYLHQLQGQVAVRVIPDLANAPAFKSQLQRLVPVSNRQSRAFTAHIALPQSSPLAVGMSANAELYLNGGKDGTIWLPSSAIKQHPDGGSSVFAVQNKKAKRFIVEIVERKNQQVALSGAPAGLSYVASGVELLQDGEAVTISQSKASGGNND